jgi:hypothetical protein
MATRERRAAATTVLALSVALLAPDRSASAVTKFPMAVSAGASVCLPKASGTVRISSGSSVETMSVTVTGMPPSTKFDVFVLQVPKAPFGVSFYEGAVRTNRSGRGRQHFTGAFDVHSFAVGPGSAPAPVVFNGPFPDASLNPPFNPLQMYHLGLWFDSPQAAQSAGCPATVTPFNGEHNAGIQVLNTSNFTDDHGPLRDVIPNP